MRKRFRIFYITYNGDVFLTNLFSDDYHNNLFDEYEHALHILSEHLENNETEVNYTILPVYSKY